MPVEGVLLLPRRLACVIFIEIRWGKNVVSPHRGRPFFHAGEIDRAEGL
jgi:hypothetical protein